MSDIVERLRELEPSMTIGKDCKDAADEIVRLRAEVASAVEDYKKSLKPVAWGVPNSRPTERRQFLSLLHELPVEGGVDGRRKTPIYPAMLVPLYRLDGESDE